MTSTPQHLLTAPESSFLERLNAVEEELDCSPSYTYSQVTPPSQPPPRVCLTSCLFSPTCVPVSVWKGKQTMMMAAMKAPAAWHTARAQNIPWSTFLWVSWRRSFWPLT